MSSLSNENMVSDTEVNNLFVEMWNTGEFPSNQEAAEQKILKYSKSKYLSRTDRMKLDEADKELFSWLTGPVKFHIILSSSLDNKAITILILEKSEVDAVVFHDFKNQTADYSVCSLTNQDKIKYIISKQLIPDLNIENIIPASLLIGSASLPYFIADWVQKEFENVAHFVAPAIDNLDFSTSIIRSRKYDIQHMLETINNQQFSAELMECIHAYENEKWFICAAGLGGVLEHLLYLILEKNKMIDSNFPDDATAKIYIEHLSRNPIKLSKREKTNIRVLFLTRNSVSHFNQGFTSKDQCSHLLNGIKDIFNNYYLKDFSNDGK